MNVILDTNIVISAILKDRTPETIIRFIISNPPWRWLASTAIVDEYRSVLRRPKFKLPGTLITSWETLFHDHIKRVAVANTTSFSRDPKDAKFLQCLETDETALFVTGDQDFSAAPLHLQARIYSIMAFKLLIETWIDESQSA